ncbi:unnamed protein product [Urochloa humidicola]
MRIEPHEFYNDTMTAMRSLLGVIDDGEAAAAASSFVAWPMLETAVGAGGGGEATAAAASFVAWPMRRVPASSARAGPAGDDGGDQRRRGLLRCVPGRVRGRQGA